MPPPTHTPCTHSASLVQKDSVLLPLHKERHRMHACMQPRRRQVQGQQLLLQQRQARQHMQPLEPLWPLRPLQPLGHAEPLQQLRPLGHLEPLPGCSPWSPKSL